MPGIESYGRQRSDDSDNLRTAEQLGALYKRAVTALNQYLTVKLGAGKAPLAGLLLNHMFSDEVLAPPDAATAAAAKEFASLGGHLLDDRTREVVESLPVVRRLLLSTLWTKRFVDLAHERRSQVEALDRSWVFRTYSEDYPLLPLSQYEIAVRDFEQHVEVELADYLEKYGRAEETDTDGRDSFLSALAAYAQVLNDALEQESHHENRMHHLGHLAMAARMYTYCQVPDSSISLERIHHIETHSHGGKLPGDTAQTVREAWHEFEPILREYIESEREVRT
jgi:hypothetical protein